MNYNEVWEEIKVLPQVVNNFVFADRSGMKYQYIRYGQHPLQYMLYIPSSNPTTSKNEFIYFIHGGGWRFGKPERYTPVARLFCNLGYDVILTTHRRVPKYKFPHLHEDTFLSFHKAKSLPNIKDKKAIVIGISAGGNLGGLLVYDRLALSKIGVEQSDFKGFVSVAGAMDLTTFPDSLPLRQYTGRRGGDEFHRANPTSYIQSSESLPVLCVHGTKDAIVPYKSSISFTEKLQDSQCPKAELYTVKGGTHFQTTTDWWLKYNQETEYIVEWVTTL